MTEGQQSATPQTNRAMMGTMMHIWLLAFGLLVVFVTIGQFGIWGFVAVTILAYVAGSLAVYWVGRTEQSQEPKSREEIMAERYVDGEIETVIQLEKRLEDVMTDAE